MPVHTMKYVEAWLAQCIKIGICSLLCAFCLPLAVIEGGCLISFSTHGSWSTEMHDWWGTSCERNVHSHMTLVHPHVMWPLGLIHAILPMTVQAHVNYCLFSALCIHLFGFVKSHALFTFFHTLSDNACVSFLYPIWQWLYLNSVMKKKQEMWTRPMLDEWKRVSSVTYSYYWWCDAIFIYELIFKHMEKILLMKWSENRK